MPVVNPGNPLLCVTKKHREMKCIYFLLAGLLLIRCAQHQTPADLVFQGGRIYTADEKNTVAEAIAVAGDRIIYVGTRDGVKKYIGEKTNIVDLHGQTLTPGIIESHGHLMGLGFSELNLDLSTTKNYEDLIEKVRVAAAAAKPGQWILGSGWHQEKWDKSPPKMIKGYPTHELLSAASPNNPVYLRHASGHAALANAKAMQISGVNILVIEKLEKNLGDAGEVIRDELGNPTGIFNERAMQLIGEHIPAATEEITEQALDLAQAACLRNGVTSFQDAGVSRSTVELYRKFKSSGKLKVRLYGMLTGYDPGLLEEWYKKGPEIDSTHWLTIRAIKLNCDGALGSRGAWLLEPYTDRPGFYGNETLPMEVVLQTSRQALDHGFQVCSHAIGDRANREILDRYEKAFGEKPGQSKDHRFRIEHAQHLNQADIPRFGKLGVIASMQTVHLSSDRPWAIDRLGKKRIEEGAYAWQSLIKSGAVVINGTDVPVEPINPVASFYSAVTRKTLKGEPEGGYEPAEKMTRGQALAASTRLAAYGAFEEKIKGVLAPGMLADLTIFSQDIMTIPEAEILKTKVAMTVVGGKVLYRKP
jgi:predicted amidohydrolase YtcJ